MATYLLIDRPAYDSAIPDVLVAHGQGLNLPPKGAGYLAGTYPDGITKIEGVPGSATVRVLYRASGIGDGVIVAEVQSGIDGTWRVEGLDPSLKFDVVCRSAGYNDMIKSNVSPMVD